MAYQSVYSTAIKSIRWEPDALFDSYWFNKFIGLFVKHGKRLKAEKLVLGAVKEFKARFKKISFHNFFIGMLRAIKPVIGLGHRRLGLVYINTPYVINSARGIKIVFRWILERVSSFTDRNLEDRLINTIYVLYSPALIRTMLHARRTYLAKLQESTRYEHFRWM